LLRLGVVQLSGLPTGACRVLAMVEKVAAMGHERMKGLQCRLEARRKDCRADYRGPR